MPGPELLQMDPTEACDKLRVTLKVLGTFKSFYFAYKTTSAVEVPHNPWKFQNGVLFSRLDAFMERCYDMLDLQSTCLQFSKLERVEVGGTKGKTLTSAIKQVHQDFITAHEKFQQVSTGGSGMQCVCSRLIGNVSKSCSVSVCVGLGSCLCVQHWVHST